MGWVPVAHTLFWFATGNLPMAHCENYATGMHVAVGHLEAHAPQVNGGRVGWGHGRLPVAHRTGVRHWYVLICGAGYSGAPLVFAYTNRTDYPWRTQHNAPLVRAILEVRLRLVRHW